MSSVIKSSFVSLSDTKKKIEVINKNNSKILGNPLDKNSFDEGNDIVSEARETLTPIDMLDSAKNEGEKIVELAMQDAEGIKNKAYEEGYQVGFDTGYNEGMAKIVSEMDLQKQQLSEEIAAAQDEQLNLAKSVEPKVVDLVVGLIDNLIGKCSISKDTIMFIIKKGLEEIEVKNDIIIKVSPEDYDYVIENRSEVDSVFSNKIDVEIFKDGSLNGNDCIIETDLGNIDCGLSGRLNGLLNELKLIKESI